ncbi:MAG: thermonuclease family protein [Alphaproteobacteria bacterium]|jgi:micrococcal nuclease|tara:strand:- start:109 stop:627 length:519 start_codon:yes stop_codon:yes gene_type:complete
MYEYKCIITKIVDGDTVDIDLDLGFGVWLRDERVRLNGIDTPESRTSDKIEKVFGLAAKERLNSLLGGEAILLSQVTKGGENMKGKFGRILGNFRTMNGENVADVLMNEGHAVAYNGGDKDNVQKQHLLNRQRLIDEGKVPTPEGMSKVKGAFNEFKATKPPLKKKTNKKKK